MCLKLWHLLSKVILSLRSVALFQCVCKIYPTFLRMCHTTGRLYLYNRAFFKDIGPSHAVSFSLHA